MKTHPFAVVMLCMAVINHLVNALSIMLGHGNDNWKVFFSILGYAWFYLSGIGGEKSVHKRRVI